MTDKDANYKNLHKPFSHELNAEKSQHATNLEAAKTKKNAHIGSRGVPPYGVRKLGNLTA